MNAPLALRPSSAVSLWTPQDLALIRRTMAKDANDDEFSVYIKTARALELNPLRKHIYCFIYNKDDPKRRTMVIVTAIDGFRSVADRTGNYRPDDEAPVFHILPWKVDRDNAIVEMRREAAKEKDLRVRKSWLYDQMLALDELYPIDPTNPEGIEKVVVRVFKFSHGDWHAITAEAYWAEYAPIKEDAEGGFDWVETGETWPDSGKPKKRKVARGAVTQTLDTSGLWGKMPRGQIEKCAEAKAHRKASWSGELSNVYAEQEVDRQKYIDLAPNEMADLGAQQARLERVQTKDCLMISWTGAANEAPEEVPYGSFPDRAFAFIDSATPQAVEDWSIRNRHSLKVFWSAKKTDALEIKRRIEKAMEGAVAA